MDIQDLPYLQSPFSMQKRQEKVICFRARKIKKVKTRKQFRYLPEYLSDPSKPFILSNELQQIATEARLTADITNLIASSSNAQPQQCLENLLVFFGSLLETMKSRFG